MKGSKSSVPPFFVPPHDALRSTHDHTLKHPVNSSGKRAAHYSSLTLSVRDTRLLSSRPPTPAPSPSSSPLSLSLPCSLLLLSDKMHTSSLSLSSLFFWHFPHPLTPSAPWKQIQIRGTIRCNFHTPSTNLFLAYWAFHVMFAHGIRQSQLIMSYDVINE